MSAGVIAGVLRDFGIEPGYTLAPVGNGLIHETLVVTCGGQASYVLQRLNTAVFPDPAVLARNAVVVTDRIRRAVRQRGGDVTREVLRFVPGRDGRYFTRAGDGSHWRLSHFVPRSTTVDVAGSPEEAGAVARAFALFQRDVWDVRPGRVIDAIPGFHDTPRRYAKLCTVIESIAGDEGQERLDQARDLVAEIHERRDRLGIVESDRVAGRISTHVCHNDTKVNNVLLDEETRRPLCVIDLDTIGRGSPLMDVGDLLRTAAATVSEEEPDIARVSVNPDAAHAITGAFAEVLEGRLNERERKLLVFSGWLMTMEQAVRYLTDYLEGDVYYGARYPDHNLRRAGNQLALARSMEKQLVHQHV